MQNNTLPEPYGVLFQPAPDFDTDIPDEATAAIRILEPEYKDVVVRFHTVALNEVEAKDELAVSFNYDIISGNVPDKAKTDFEITLGNLLFDIILYKLSEVD